MQVGDELFNSEAIRKRRLSVTTYASTYEVIEGMARCPPFYEAKFSWRRKNPGRETAPATRTT
jgi:hypothetical protein